MRRQLARVTVAMLLSAACLAGIRAAGKYTGVVVFDRWGGCVLSAGPTLNYVAEAGKGSLKPFDGRTVTLDVSETHQSFNPGEALIKKFRRIAPDAEPDAAGRRVEPLRLSVKPEFADGQPAAFTIMARNVGAAPITLDYYFLSPVLLMKRREKQKFFSPADGPSVAVMTSLNFWIGPDEGPRLQSTGVQWGVPHEWRVTNVKTLPAREVLEPGAESVITMAMSLPPGEYEFFAAYCDYQSTPWCVASNLVGFDVGADRRAILPKVPGR